MRELDVAIVGGGPAGLAAAIAIKRKNPKLGVTILERSTYECFRPGETVPNRFSRLLSQLGLWDCFRAEQSGAAYGKRILWAGVHDQNALYEEEGVGWHLSRPAFDLWLTAICRVLKVKVITGARNLKVVRIPDEGWQVHWKEGEARVHFIVNATGSPAFLKHESIETNYDDHLVSTYFVGELASEDTYTTIAAAPHGWWYHCNLPGRSVFAFFTDPELVKTRRWRSAGHFVPELPNDDRFKKAFSFIDVVQKPDWFNIKPHISSCTGSGWLAVGDAALKFDPLSGQGIYKAFETAIWASYAIHDYWQGDTEGMKKYERIIAGMFSAYAHTRRKMYEAEKAYDTLFWQARNNHYQPAL